MALTMDESTVMPGATAGAAGSSEADARVVDATPKSGVEKLVVPEDQATFLETSKGVVGHAMRPPSPLVVPPTTKEDEVEEIEHEEARPQAIWILRKRGDEVVVVEEEDTTRDVRSLESTLSMVMKQIKVSIVSALSVFGIGE